MPDAYLDVLSINHQLKGELAALRSVAAGLETLTRLGDRALLPPEGEVESTPYERMLKALPPAFTVREAVTQLMQGGLSGPEAMQCLQYGLRRSILRGGAFRLHKVHHLLEV